MLEEDGGVGEKRGASDFYISQCGRTMRDFCRGVWVVTMLIQGKNQGVGAGVRDLAFGPSNHESCTLSLRQGSGPDVGLQGVLFLCCVLWLITSRVPTLDLSNMTDGVQKAVLLAPRSWFFDAFFSLMTRSPFSLKTPVPSCFPSAVIKIV